MIQQLVIFGSSFVIALSGAMVPGPLLTVTISESARRGAMTGPLLIVGHGILELLLLIAIMMGLAPFLSRDSVFIATAIAGGCFLGWLSFSMFRDLPSLNIATNTTNSSERNLVFSGALMSLANPFWIVWWATIGIGYIVYASGFGVWGVFSFFTGHILADLAWYAFVSAAISKGRHVLNDNIYRWLIGICATLLMIFAAFFIITGIQKFL